MTPFLARDPGAFRGLEDRALHALRVALSAITLTASFYAVARLPLALFTALMFTRPVVTMLMARAASWASGSPRGAGSRRWRPSPGSSSRCGQGAAGALVFARWPPPGVVVPDRHRRGHRDAAPARCSQDRDDGLLHTAGLAALTAPFAARVLVAPSPPSHWPPLPRRGGY